MAKNEVRKQDFNTKLSYVTDQYVGLMRTDFEEYGVDFDNYSKNCVVAAMSSIYQLAQSKKFDIQSFNGSNLRQVLGQVASLKLNANAVPRECYFTLRKQQNPQGQWEEVVELGIEGDGNDALLRQHGVNVETVYPCWLVKEGDDFTYPRHKGLDVEPPSWEECGESQTVIRVVYPVKLKDGNVTYLIAERESVKVNLIAHIRNNMMNETFGICESRYKANEKQKKQIAEKKQEVMDAVRECETVEDILSCDVARPYISAAWLDTPEAMIVRKMRNNAIKKFPKNLNNIAAKSLVEMDDTYKNVQEAIEVEADTEEMPVDPAILEDADMIDAETVPAESNSVFEGGD